ncbi:MAG: hypothetical protein IBX43_05175 [Campylobacterales bacterium]|nr:hypothetical protein [Campylobacterales bacterium]
MKSKSIGKIKETPMIQGDEIRFEGTDEVFTIKAMDQRYLICVRPYTIEESIKEKDEWINNLFNLVDGLTEEEESEYMLKNSNKAK